MQNLLAVEQHEFERRIKDIHNHLYANANVRTNEAIAAEVVKILLALIHTATNGNRSAKPISRDDRLAAIRGDETAVARLYEDTQRLFHDMNRKLRRYPQPSRIDLDALSIAYVRAQLDGVLFTSVNRDWLGDAMEVFRSLDAKRLGGQFFTDQRITDLSVRLLEFDPQAGDDFIDICAGTGGFLLAAARKLADTPADPNTPTPIHGLEVDPALERVANGSLVTLLPKRSYVLNADSLANPEKWSPTVRRTIIAGTHLCLASNPPFGTKITIKDEAVLRQYDLAARWCRYANKWIRSRPGVVSRPPDILFLERNLSLAEPGRGRVALVTPYQVLSGPQLGYARQWILRHARIRAVIDLPVETFQPWTGTKTSLLVLERRQLPLDHWDPTAEAYDIFMSTAKYIGHDRRGNPVIGDDGSILTDLPAIGEAFELYRRNKPFDDVHDASYVLSSSEITWENDLRLNASFYHRTTSDVRAAVSAIHRHQDWQLTTIGEVSERIFYPTRFKRHYIAPGPNAIPFYGGSQISQLIPTTAKYLSRSSPNISDLLVSPGWVLVTRSGSTGIVSSVPKAWDGVAMSEHVIRIIFSTIEGAYLEAYLRSSTGQRLLAAGVFGSVIDEITPEHIASLPLPIPKRKKEFERICQPLSAAYIARDAAISGIEKAISLIEERLADAF